MSGALIIESWAPNTACDPCAVVAEYTAIAICYPSGYSPEGYPEPPFWYDVPTAFAEARAHFKLADSDPDPPFADPAFSVWVAGGGVFIPQLWTKYFWYPSGDSTIVGPYDPAPDPPPGETLWGTSTFAYPSLAATVNLQYGPLSYSANSLYQSGTESLYNLASWHVTGELALGAGAYMTSPTPLPNAKLYPLINGGYPGNGIAPVDPLPGGSMNTYWICDMCGEQGWMYLFFKHPHA